MPTKSRTIGQVRRNGWPAPLLSHALSFLAERVGPASAAATDDERWAHELLRWFAAAEPGKLASALRYAQRDRVLTVGPDYEVLAQILASDPDGRIARLRSTYADPGRALIELVQDLGEDEHSEWKRHLPEPHASAVLALGELGTIDAIRFLLVCASTWTSEPACDPIFAALERAPGLLATTIELWHTSTGYQRNVMLEALAKRPAHEMHDDRLTLLLTRWLSEAVEDDLLDAVLAADSYNLPGLTVPYLNDVFERSLAAGWTGIAREVVAVLEAFGAPNGEQRARVEAMCARTAGEGEDHGDEGSN